jgi:hypothetical protein
MTNEEFKEWKAHPITKEVFLYIAAYRLLASQNATSPELPSRPNMALLAAQYIGQIEAYDSVLNFEVVDQEVNTNDDEDSEGSRAQDSD